VFALSEPAPQAPAQVLEQLFLEDAPVLMTAIRDSIDKFDSRVLRTLEKVMEMLEQDLRTMVLSAV
jgi:hypothetical protein